MSNYFKMRLFKVYVQHFWEIMGHFWSCHLAMESVWYQELGNSQHCRTAFPGQRRIFSLVLFRTSDHKSSVLKRSTSMIWQLLQFDLYSFPSIILYPLWPWCTTCMCSTGADTFGFGWAPCIGEAQLDTQRVQDSAVKNCFHSADQVFSLD